MKKQLTVQMTLQEGKSKSYREILRYDKKKKQKSITRCWKPIHIIKDL